MTDPIIITGSIRSKKNSKRIFKVGKFTKVLPSKAYVEWEEQAHKELWATRGRIFHEEPVWIKAVFYYRGPRPDIHGCMESLADCIEGILIANDRQIESWDGTRIAHDKDDPRTEFQIYSYVDIPF